jgi:putative phosphoesterase
MRLAVLSDIHGNLLALEAVLADLPAQAPDLVVNLGDHVSGPLWAAETADLLRAQSNWLHIRGNHDRQMATLHPHEMGASDRAASAAIVPGQREWLGALPASLVVEDRSILLCHGAPSSDETHLTEDVSTGFARPAPPSSIAELAEPACAAGVRIILCGHSHMPRIVRLPGGVTVANPGSVGLPAYFDPSHRFPHAIENGSPAARYLLLDIGSRSGDLAANFRVLEYGWDRAADLAAVNGRPDWAHALRTGYALIPPGALQSPSSP